MINEPRRAKIFFTGPRGIFSSAHYLAAKMKRTGGLREFEIIKGVEMKC